MSAAVATASVGALGQALGAFGLREAAAVVTAAAPDAAEALRVATSGRSSDPVAIVTSVTATAVGALNAAGHSDVAAWVLLLAPALHALVERLLLRELRGTRLDGLADLT